MKKYLILFALFSSQLAAQSSAGALNGESFRPALTSNGILDVESGGIDAASKYDVGFWLWYAHNPLIVSERANSEQANALVSTRFGGSITSGFAISSQFLVGLELPFILFQDGEVGIPWIEPNLQVDSVQAFGIGDLRLVPKVQILEQRKHHTNLSLLTHVTLPTAQPTDNYFGESDFTFEPALALSGAYKSGLRYAMNMGYRYRTAESVLNVSLGSRIDGRIGLGYDFGQHGFFGLDWSVATQYNLDVSRGDGSRDFQDPIETTFGFRSVLDSKTLLFGGVGAGLIGGPGTPLYRVFVGVRYTPAGCDDSDSDGVCDIEDQCIHDPEDRDGFADDDGCPDVDNDQDNILDVNDKCPELAEDVDSFNDEDGCPDGDNDGDGIHDRNDRCPLKPGAPEHGGCPKLDTDLDGVLDIDDKCPTERGKPLHNGCPEPDRDGDGLNSETDKCPDEPGPIELDGCPDSDGDGYIDAEDKCPEEQEIFNGNEDDDGCADGGIAMAHIEGEKIVFRKEIVFERLKSNLSSKSFTTLDHVAAILKAHKELQRVLIESHTGRTNDENKMLALSEDRAKAVRQYLIDKGIEESRLRARGFGSSQPPKQIKGKKKISARRIEITLVDIVRKNEEARLKAEAEAKKNKEEQERLEAERIAQEEQAKREAEEKAALEKIEAEKKRLEEERLKLEADRKRLEDEIQNARANAVSLKDLAEEDEAQKKASDWDSESPSDEKVKSGADSKSNDVVKDSDGDGYPDYRDKCPEKAEVFNNKKDEDGCPDKGKSLITWEKDHIELKERVRFKPFKADISGISYDLLDQVASAMKAHREVEVFMVEGHTDNKGSKSKKKKLSTDRARAVVKYLISKGVDKKRLEAQGFGGEKPVASNNDRDGRDKNRRIDFVFKSK